MKMKLKEIVFDKRIYPREKGEARKDKVDEYVEAMKSGDKFPPLIVHIPTKILLDGWHRHLAYEETGLEEVDADLTEKPKITDLEKEWFKLKLESARLNARHGIQLTYSEKQDIALDVAKADINKELSQEEIGKNLGVAQTTVGKWIKDIREKQERERDFLIYRLTKLGWKGLEIATTLNISESTISNTKNFSFNNFIKIKDSLLQKGYDVSAIARKTGCNDIPLLWSLILADDSDMEKMNKFGCEPKIFNIWGFSKRDERLGVITKGNIPGQITMNVLYYYTKPGDLIVDPMAGGGSTIDACLVMNRKCRAYDKNPNNERRDILKRDVIIEGFDPKVKGKCDLIFLEPPYYNMVFEDDFKNIEEFYSFMENVTQKSYDAVKPGGIVTLVMGDWTKENPHICLSGDCYKIFSKKFVCIEHIDVPQSTEQYKGIVQKQAREKKKILGIRRSLFVFQKE